MRADVDACPVEHCARSLHSAFCNYDAAFAAITKRAKTRFEQRDWEGGQRDAAERIGLYDRHVNASVQALRARLGARAEDRDLWVAIKAAFAQLVAPHPDIEFTKTYFSSVTRRLFGTVGADPKIEFVGEETTPLRNTDGPCVGPNYVYTGSLEDVFRALLADYTWSVPYADAAGCAAFVAEQVEEHYRRSQDGDTVQCVDVLAPVFYRDTRAYVIGKSTGWVSSSPLILALANRERGIVVDAVIQSEAGASALFGCARPYFHADLQPVGPAIVFLRRVVPQETVHELFTIVGRAKQGKTERFRALARHLRFSRDRFVVAPGKKGMVMAVFTLPSADAVFKVIRDQFAFPKDTSRQEVMRRYAFAKRHNKAGRMVDAQEFRMLRLQRDRFDAAVLDELLGDCASTVRVDGDSIVLDHVYIERRLRPLDLYLREVSASSAARAVIDYGQALRDLAATDVFPGDLLPKNFGVGRPGRVVFYDYDEISPLSTCCFRDIPATRSYDDELSGDPWYSVGHADVFPEEFGRFLGFGEHLKRVFLQAHGELLTAQWWRSMQARVRAGEVIEVLPYGSDCRRPSASLAATEAVARCVDAARDAAPSSRP